MRRRDFIFVLLAAPLAGGAQQVGKVYRIGYLLEGPPGQTSPQGRALEETLREIGYLEGQNITLEACWLDRSRWIPQKLAAESRRPQDLTLLSPGGDRRDCCQASRLDHRDPLSHGGC
jgi:hypothetical protein